ncbi:site-specific integrase [Enterococcus faecalis]|uniref:site-specific integrase n=1 Tax=Enterococcus faecalis TaxID=1351 RepID=UPI0011424AE6|nr:site-specific integrase [Enterococcus faecalis]EGO2614384.1 site-specific integrase [Enterococcus faecalis]EGO2621324.1 site-specific integrase [Enterococcus faecalis]EGO6739163.1 site-specific integrase [Enterococcus faecalis]EHE8496681.1 site-specific integrase [Enterococcus faecalis]EHF3565370.1 site-specific integrase [Enterococcus faecalis]
MAHIQKYTKKDGSSAYLFQAYIGINPKTGKPKKTTRRGFKTIREAKLALAAIEMNGVTEDNQPVIKKTYEETYYLWYEEYKTTVKESTLLKTERIFKNHILPAFGKNNIDEILPLDVQKQMNIWHEKFARATTMMNYAGLVFDYALRMQLISINPTKVIKKPVRKKVVKEDKDLNFYDKEELKEFLANAEQADNFRAFVFFRLLAFTGMRKGEALALKWSDVNFDKYTLNINKAVSRRETGLYIQTPKTPSSIRRISLDHKTLEILKEFKHGITDEEKLIFHSDSEEILSPSKTRKWLITIQNRIDKNRNSNNKEPMKRITTHGFRHTHASLLFEAGATIKDVQLRLGHSDIQTTMDVYTHVSKEAKEKLAQKFNSYIDF